MNSSSSSITPAIDSVEGALRVLEIAKARSGALIGRSDIDNAARRFGLGAKQIAALERRAEEKKLLALRVSPDDTGHQRSVIDDFDILDAFRRDVGAVKLMSPTEEIEHGDAVAFGLAAKEALRTEDLDDEERERLAESVRRGDAAFAEFVRRNAPLVMNIARAHQFRGLDLPDLIQNGMLGLMRAIERWDPHRGYRFSTFATHWIRQRIDRGLADTGRAIRLPVHVIAWQARIGRAERDLLRTLNRAPTLYEISEQIGLPPDKVALYSDLGSALVSLDAPAVDDTGATIADFQATHDLGPLANVLANERTDAIIDLLRPLAKRQRTILIRRFGLDGSPASTLDEIGTAFGITRERVRQIEAKALNKLRDTIAHSPIKEVLKL